MEKNNEQDRIGRALRDGAAYLARRQARDGSFAGRIISGDGTRRRASPAIFPTTLVLTALAPLRSSPDPALQHLFRRGAAFLKSIQKPAGSFNYWDAKRKRGSAYACPDDLDDTALALAALYIYHNRPAAGEAAGKLARMLTAVERAEGGPYNTWLIDWRAHVAWDDCDLGVNANIAYLLSLFEVRLPKLERWFERALRTNDLSSVYYPEPLAVLYLLSRAYRGRLSAAARKRVLALRNKAGHWGSPLRTALALSALARWGGLAAAGGQASAYLLAAQKRDAWPEEPFYFERSRKDEAWYGGSAEMTTAFCMEALTLAIAAMPPPADDKNGGGRDSGAKKMERLRAETVREFLRRCARTSPAFKKIAAGFSSAFLADPFWKENILLPLRWQDAMGKRNSSTPETAAFELGVAHCFGLAAYHMADDLVDGEGEPAHLPFALFALREFLSIYLRLLGDARYPAIAVLLDGVETAMHREAAARLRPAAASESGNGMAWKMGAMPKLADLVCSEKSLGQAAPCVALLLLAGEGPGSKAVRGAVGFFDHFLAARQWNDDAHDLVEDLARGRVTPAGWHALRAFKKKHPRGRTLDVRARGPELLQAFWREVFPKMRQEVERRLGAAQRALTQAGLADPSYFESLLSGQRELLERAAAERGRALAFMRTYRASR